MTVPLCSLCAQQLYRGPRPMHRTAGGGWVCPICGRNVPRRLTRGQADHLLRRKDS